MPWNSTWSTITLKRTDHSKAVKLAGALQKRLGRTISTGQTVGFVCQFILRDPKRITELVSTINPDKLNRPGRKTR